MGVNDVKNEAQKIKELKELRNAYRSKFSVIKEAKDAILKLFRKKVEEKKIEEIRQTILKQ
jgi:hypothetical protein